jgi:Ribbon-helix-helix protein, copG family.
MRTTLTLDDDLFMALNERARATGRSFKEVVNEVVRKGLAPSEPRSAVDPPVVDLGGLRLSADEAEALGEDAEVVRFLRVTEQLERDVN